MNANKIRTIDCEFCGQTITKRMPDGRRYCSLACYRKSPRPDRMTGERKACEQCSGKFYVPKNRIDARFCSPDCVNAWQSRGKVECSCKTCSKSFRRSASMVPSDIFVYCSIGCRDADPDQRQRLMEMIRKQQIGGETEPERIGYSILSSLGVHYDPQHVIGGKFCVDAFVPASNLIVQFDGDYWHCNPAKFPVPDARQRKRIGLDRSQDAYMAKCGYRVLRIWESDLKKRPELAREMIAKAL